MILTEQLVKTIAEKNKEPQWLLNKRLHALKRFNELEKPKFTYGIGIFADITDLDMTNIDPQNSLQETPNGLHVSAPTPVEILPLATALAKYGKELKDYFTHKLIFAEENKLTALHEAFFTTATIIRIPAGTQTTAPLYICINQNHPTRIEHVIIIAEMGSRATIIETTSSSSTLQHAFCSHTVDIIAQENATITYSMVQNLDMNVHNFVTHRAFVSANAAVHWTDCNMGSKFTQCNTTTILEGEGAESTSSGVAFGNKQQCFDINTATIHAASNTSCNMLTKVVLNDKAKTIYRGLVRIAPKSYKCNGYQKEETILLSEDARIDAVPNLQIENNDVKCSHGTTITQVDADKLFYMMSRGLDDLTAKKAIIEGFFSPILITIPDETLRETIIREVAQRLNAIH